MTSVFQHNYKAFDLCQLVLIYISLLESGLSHNSQRSENTSVGQRGERGTVVRKSRKIGKAMGSGKDGNSNCSASSCCGQVAVGLNTISKNEVNYK